MDNRQYLLMISLECFEPYHWHRREDMPKLYSFDEMTNEEKTQWIMNIQDITKVSFCTADLKWHLTFTPLQHAAECTEWQALVSYTRSTQLREAVTRRRRAYACFHNYTVLTSPSCYFTTSIEDRLRNEGWAHLVAACNYYTFPFMKEANQPRDLTDRSK